jgi:TPP-dependent indolepyruvate ferredoxin oxidoreductase alpha subunit
MFDGVDVLMVLPIMQRAIEERKHALEKWHMAEEMRPLLEEEIDALERVSDDLARMIGLRGSDKHGNTTVQ